MYGLKHFCPVPHEQHHADIAARDPGGTSCVVLHSASYCRAAPKSWLRAASALDGHAAALRRFRGRRRRLRSPNGSKAVQQLEPPGHAPLLKFTAVFAPTRKRLKDLWEAVTSVATVFTLVAAVWSTLLSRRDAREARAQLAALREEQLRQELAQVICHWEVDNSSTPDRLRLAAVMTNRSQHVVENVSALKPEGFRVHVELLLPGETRREVADYDDVTAPLVRRFKRGSLYVAFSFGGQPWEKTTDGYVYPLHSNSLRPR